MKTEPPTALARQDSTLPVRTMDDLIQLGSFLEKSGMFGCTSQGQGLVIAATCVQEGMSLLQFKRQFHILNGTPTMRADAMLAGLRQQGGSYKILARTTEKAEVEMESHGTAGKFSFTHDEAKQEPFYTLKDDKTVAPNYATPRKRMQMLWARVVSDGVRVIAPEVVAGVYTPEETAEFSHEINVTPDYTPPPAVRETPPKPKPDPVLAAPKPSPEPEPAKVVAAEVVEPDVDPAIVPFGKPKGKPWSSLTLKALNIYKSQGGERLTDAHYAEIEKAIAAKGTKDA